MGSAEITTLLIAVGKMRGAKDGALQSKPEARMQWMEWVDGRRRGSERGRRWLLSAGELLGSSGLGSQLLGWKSRISGIDQGSLGGRSTVVAPSCLPT